MTSASSLQPDARIRHHSVEVRGGRIHVAEAGSGPLVLLVHGFPESWYSWRHQLTALAAAGFRAAAIDVRGYGRSSKPEAVEAYRITELVADNVDVVHALGERTPTIVGHDWGSPIAARSALLEPDTFTALGLLSIAYTPPGGPGSPRPSDVFARIGGPDVEFYMSYFQRPGRAEAEIEPHVREWLRGTYIALGGGAPAAPGGATPYFITTGGHFSDGFAVDAALPAWLGEDDLDVFVGEFERTGLTGGLNRYRNVDRDWEDLVGHEGRPITQPSIFIAGAEDASVAWLTKDIAAHETTLPGLRGSHVLEGAGHWIQQERADEVNALLVEFLRSLG